MCKQCEIKNCVRPYYARNRCKLHYRSLPDIKEKLKLYEREYRKKNIEKIKKREKEYKDKIKHTEDFKEYKKKYSKKYTEDNKEKLKKQKKEYYTKNKETISQRNKEIYKNRKKEIRDRQRKYEREKLLDTNFKLRKTLRARVRLSLKGKQKKGSTVRDLGCSIEELKFYLESKFYDNSETGEKMTWDNWSYSGWHIDHILPLSSFDLTDREQFLKACHFTNLQPLWAKENFEKRDKVLKIEG